MLPGKWWAKEPGEVRHHQRWWADGKQVRPAISTAWRPCNETHTHTHKGSPREGDTRRRTQTREICSAEERARRGHYTDSSFNQSSDESRISETSRSLVVRKYSSFHHSLIIETWEPVSHWACSWWPFKWHSTRYYLPTGELTLWGCPIWVNEGVVLVFSPLKENSLTHWHLTSECIFSYVQPSFVFSHALEQYSVSLQDEHCFSLSGDSTLPLCAHFCDSVDYEKHLSRGANHSSFKHAAWKCSPLPHVAGIRSCQLANKTSKWDRDR